MRKSFRPVLGLLLSLLAFSVPAWSQTLPGGGAAPAAGPSYVPGELIVKLREPESMPAAEGASAESASLRALQQRREALRRRLGALRVRGVEGLPSRARISEKARARLERRAERRAAKRGLRGKGKAAAALARAEARLAELSRVVVVELPEKSDVAALAAELQGDPEVEYAHPNYVFQAFFTPDDPFWATAGSWGQVEDDLWGLKLIEVETAWGDDPSDFENAGEGVVVAVVDSGLDIDHPDIAPNVWVNTGHGAFPAEIPDNGVDEDQNGYVDDVHGFDFTRSVDVNGDGDYDDPEDVIVPDPIDEYGHGTHVAGTIAAVGNNGLGIVGVAPKVQVMPVRGLDAGGSGTTTGLAAALVYAATNGADVINNSWGCGVCPSQGLLEDAVRLAHDMDAVVLFAAGNLADQAIRRSPQNMSETITVSALTPADELTSFSSFGPLVDVGAPGGGVAGGPAVLSVYNVLSLEGAGTSLPIALPDLVVAPGYLRLAGTSMSTPHAAGVAALLRGFDPTLSNEQVRQILRLASDPTAGAGPFAGYGRVNARKVLESTINAEVLLRTPTTVNRELQGEVTLTGFARGPNLQNVQVSLGEGEDPASFDPISTTYDPVTGVVSASFDSDLYLDGPVLARLRADDGVRSYESTTSAWIENFSIVEPVAGATLSGAADVVVNVGSSPLLQRVVVTYFNHLTGVDEVLLDTTSFPSSQLTTTLDTLASIDSDQLDAITPTLKATATYLVGGELVEMTEAVVFEIDNDRIDAPALGTSFGDTSVFAVTGSALHDVQLQARSGASWLPVGGSAPGGFSIPVDVVALGIDLDLDNRVELRLLADIDGDGQYEATEQNALTAVLIDPTLAPAWPQPVAAGQSLNGIGVTVGDVDGDGSDEAVVVPSGDPVIACADPNSGFFCTDTVTLDPDARIHVFEGDGSLNAAVLAGSAVFQEPGCSTQAALHEIDGRPGREIIWASWGQLGAIRHDGQVPEGFDPPVFNDGVFLDNGAYNTLNHTDPNHRELFPCRPVIVSRSLTGDRRLIQHTRLFDLSSGAINGFAESRVYSFDESGALVAEQNKGPSDADGPFWSVGDVDGDAIEEVVTLRPGPNEFGFGIEATLVVQIYDARNLTLESEFEANAFDPTMLLVGDLDGDGRLEIAISASAPLGFGLPNRGLYLFDSDGTPLAGSPVGYFNLAPRALADLDGDGDVEILMAAGTIGDVELHALDYDPVSDQLADLPGWPVALPHASSPSSVQSVLVGNIDAESGPEVLYASLDRITFTLGSQTSTIDRLLTVSALEADGSPWKGGWSRTVPGLTSMALGNLDAGPEPDLVLAALDLLQDDPTLPGYRAGRVLAYRLEGVFDAASMQWSHRYGTAEQSGTPPSSFSQPECNDGIDNDGDGLVDASADPGCLSPLEDDESPECSDGIDNDGDGQIDWKGGPNGEPADTNCNAGPALATETQGLGGCGLGFETAPFLLGLLWLRRRRGIR